MKRKRKNKKSKALEFPEPDFLPAVEGHKKWKDVYVRQVFFLTLLGATDTQLAQVFDVNCGTIDNWKQTKTEFYEAIQRGKLIADAKVAHSMYLAAIGYSHDDEVILTNRIKERDPRTGKVVREYTKPLRVKTVKHYPPNVTAGVKWLQARQPERWGNKVEIGGEVKHKHEIDLSKFSTEELRLLSKLGVSGEDDITDVNYTEVDD